VEDSKTPDNLSPLVTIVEIRQKQFRKKLEKILTLLLLVLVIGFRKAILNSDWFKLKKTNAVVLKKY
jgi:hypothetical protein